MSRLLRLGVGPVGDIQTVALAGGGSSSSSGRVLFSSTTLLVAAATITVSGLPATAGKDLVITYSGRGTGAVTSVLSSILFNADATAAHYSVAQYLNGNASSASASQDAATTAGVAIIQDTGVSGNANADAEATIEIKNYAGTVLFKRVRSVTSNSLPQNLIRSAVWKSAAAIAAFTLTSGATTFDVGTCVNVYIDG